MIAKGPFAIITGLSKEQGGTLVISSAEVTETYEGAVTIAGELSLRAPDLETAATWVKLTQDANASTKL